VKFIDMMALHERAPDSLVGRGPRYPWGGLYGGQIVAQSLRAAAATVASEYRVHSLHAYFIRRGDAEEPIRFEMDRLRNGRSFVTRAVVARQSMGAILHMSASFQSRDAAQYVQASPFPAAPDPGTLEKSSWTSMFDRRWIREGDGRAQAWLRIPEAPPDDHVLAACALAYLSDDLATDAVRSQQQCADGVTGRQWNGISLDHAIWFHHPLVGNEWQLHDFRCEGLGTPRGLAVGQVFSRQGHHLATVAQEALLRPVPAEA
jgi:acyl-CoA thioesterase-2